MAVEIGRKEEIPRQTLAFAKATAGQSRMRIVDLIKKEELCQK
jgi:hypothetical protein